MSDPMPTRYHSRVETPVLVRIACERCGHEYSTRQTIISTATHALGPGAALADARANVAQQLARIRLGDCSGLDGAPCPQCSHEQSWMLTNRVRSTQQVWAYGAGLVVAALLLALGITGRLLQPLALSVAVALVGGVVAYLLAGLLVRLAFKRRLQAAQQFRVRWPSVEIAPALDNKR
ncbi:MAG: hypothetical protein GX557_06010 [Chloroflexi bacterium]|nr:hypothetical protein [Chloroflexota bacterium]